MTRQKSFKRRVRSRMEKTSESYTAARRRLIAKSGSPDATPAGTSPDSLAPAGVEASRPSGDAVVANTGRDWEGWFGLLDQWEAATRKHGEIARWLMDEHQVPGWWAQSITVAYEQARGLRAPGQGRDGWYSVSVTRTVNVGVEALYEAVADPGIRSRWLPGNRLEITTNTPKSVRGRWDGGGSRVVIGLEHREDAKSRISLTHERIPDAQARGELKRYWAERLQALKDQLES